MLDEPTQKIADPEIKGIMDQYFKIVSIIKDDCKKRGITFFGYGYLRKGDSIGNAASYSMQCTTAIDPYDKWRLEKDLDNQIGL